MRVRIRRFRGLRSAIVQARKTKRVEVGSGQREVQCGTVGHAPRTARAACCLSSQGRDDASVTQFAEPHGAAFPLLPDPGSQTMANPVIQISQRPSGLTEAEVALPAP